MLSAYFHVERIENVMGAGMPDTVLVAPGAPTVFLELKAVAGWPARAATRVLGSHDGLSQDQKNWHMTWRAAGGFSAILVGVGGEEQFLFPGWMHDVINDLTQEQFCPVAPRDWLTISKALIDPEWYVK